MEKIELKDVNVGDYFYIVDYTDEKRRFIIKKVTENKLEPMFKWWCLEKKSDDYLFEPMYIGDSDTHLNDYTFGTFRIFKLNQKEVSEFTKMLILLNLK